MAKWNYFQRLTLLNRYRNALNILSVLEILFSICSIGLAIAAIVLSRGNYLQCYNQAQAGTGITNCNLYDRLNLYSLTAQGIWAGVLLIISAAITIDFTKVTSWKTWSYASGFTSFANGLTIPVIIFESLAVSEYIAAGYVNRNTYDYQLWCLHVTLLSVGCMLWLLSTMKSATIQKVRGWGQVAVADADIPLETPPPASYSNPRYG